ncbi:hypothetical protein, partial [Bacteroides caccae]|uniref:hypothetical protein n=1 Tax=Bacteroides caccae TaxID=47678 RepID=UPI0018648A0F
SERTHCRGLYKMTGELSSIMRVPGMVVPVVFLPPANGRMEKGKESPVVVPGSLFCAEYPVLLR